MVPPLHPTFRAALMLGAALAAPARAADVPAADAPAEIVVTAERLRLPGQVDAPQPPLVTLDEGEIAAYGATSIAGLIAAIAPQTGSGRGRGGGFPIMLVNGVRISSFREMRDFPPEAIRRVEILPEEVALRYGYPPDQRVVNLILKDKFSSKRAEISMGLPTRGGWSTAAAEGTAMRIRGPQRFSLNASIDHTTPLTEAERPLVQSVVRTVPTDPDPAADRTLIPVGARASVLALTCLHSAGSRPFVLEQRLISLVAVPQAAEIDFAKEPPGTWLLQHVPWNEATHEIAAIEADTDLAATLDIPEGRACLAVERTTWRSTAPVTHVRLVFPGDMMRLVAAFTPAQAGKRQERELESAS